MTSYMTSYAEGIQDFQQELICSICMEYFTNPVSIECGHSFCHGCLLRYWRGDSPPFFCPECRSGTSRRDFKANVRLGKLAVIAKKVRPDCSQYSERCAKCEVHQKMHKLFCEDERRPVCVYCSQSQKHEAHILRCIDEAAEGFRDRLQGSVTDLWKKTEDVVQQISNDKIKFALLEVEIENQKKSVLSEFQKMKQFLNEEKDAFLSCLQELGMANLEALNKTINELFHQNQQIRKRITELEEEREKPDLDLLQDMKGVLNRNESVLLKEIQTFGIRMAIWPIPRLMEHIFNLKVDITLDCNTADPGLIISEDLKSVRYGGVQEEAHNNSGRLRDFAQVLGTQSFISGRYYWEVEVPNNTMWCVGICPKSKESRDFFVLRTVQSPNSCYLYVMAQHNLYSKVHTKYRQVGVSNLKVGIFLDCERGEVSFYHVKSRYLIYTFPATSFSGPLVPFFCLSKKVLTDDCSLTICP
ncbi:E3 ubiquitin-protein ligase TRIM11-like [Phascolarctos cinereus]|uniref:E3 ubiquitin-protein ligase TRIM11-like n=1 Tax=Phascolarctos cinereus TaxID=38626 RepID=A0A6P5IY19_PHACI|nr:E3 ubiquitin-protein ligase TRIM11-like [Phascolarctos cinereus]